MTDHDLTINDRTVTMTISLNRAPDQQTAFTTLGYLFMHVDSIISGNLSVGGISRRTEVTGEFNSPKYVTTYDCECAEMAAELFGAVTTALAKRDVIHAKEQQTDSVNDDLLTPDILQDIADRTGKKVHYVNADCSDQDMPEEMKRLIEELGDLVTTRERAIH